MTSGGRDRAIGACRRARRADLAVAFVDEALAQGTFDLSESLLVDALRACAVQGHQEAQAARLWQLLVERAQPGSPGVRAYNARLQERGTAKDWLWALRRTMPS